MKQETKVQIVLTIIGSIIGGLIMMSIIDYINRPPSRSKSVGEKLDVPEETKPKRYWMDFRQCPTRGNCTDQKQFFEVILEEIKD